MATTSSLKNLDPKLQAIFGILSKSNDAEIRKILNSTDEKLLGFAKFIGSNRAGWEGTGLELVWFPSGQIEISSFVETGIDSGNCVSFIVSLQPTWCYDNFPNGQEWKIEAEIYADCQHKTRCASMHLVYKLPSVICKHPVDSALALFNITEELIQLGKEKPLEHWFRLAGDETSS